MKSWRILLAVVLAAAAVLAVNVSGPAQAVEIPAMVCSDLNNPLYDDEYNAGTLLVADWQFKAGDTITVKGDFSDTITLAVGARVAEPAVQMFLRRDLSFQNGPFPGQLSYTFSSDTALTMVAWGLSYPDTGAALPLGILKAAWDVSCTGAAAPATSSEPVPGCDLGVGLTDNAAVGAFVWTTDVFWGPDSNNTTGLTFEAGKTAWVLGVDASGEYYQFVWSCNLLWAPVNTLGPNFDDVWNGTPLPTTVVE